MAITLLADTPRPPGAVRLTGRPGFRVRVGDCRILYEVEDERLIVVVIALGHRQRLYER